MVRVHLAAEPHRRFPAYGRLLVHVALVAELAHRVGGGRWKEEELRARDLPVS